ncbi:type IV secretory system conjugative DNA transfer family protein [Agrobacterium tumefaciens]|uniref:type IV secretory system conjugative DNA transfer family protein n=1 Tax=Agrobacterium tumefaciens TaxID=358 RepID=UPI003977BD8D
MCLSGHTEAEDQTLRRVRANLSEPEPKLRARLTKIYEGSESDFVKENVSVFVNMTPETFFSVFMPMRHGNPLAVLSQLCRTCIGRQLTDDLADGGTIFWVALDLKVLEAHPGLARVVIGSLLNAIYNRNGNVEGRTLFLLDEVAVPATCASSKPLRDGRNMASCCTMIFQSLGQMREAHGGRDATSKWFESASDFVCVPTIPIPPTISRSAVETPPSRRRPFRPTVQPE